MPAKGIGISPYITRKKKGGGSSIPTSTNATVQAWLNKIGVDGYTYPSQSKVDIYTTAWDYADAQGLTNQFDLVGLPQVPNIDLVKVPFIHRGGASARFTFVNEADLLFDPLQGITNSDFGSFDGYVETSFNASTQAVAATLDNTSLGAYVKGRITLDKGNVNIFGANVSGNACYVGSSSLNIFCRINNSGLNSNFADSTTDSLFQSAVRTNATQNNNYINGVLKNTLSANSVSRPNLTMKVLTITASTGQNNCYTSFVSFFYYGSGAIDQAKMNTFVNLLLL